MLHPNYASLFPIIILLGERIGNFIAITSDSHTKNAVASNIESLIRGMYLLPAAHGNRLVTKILSKPVLKKQW